MVNESRVPGEEVLITKDKIVNGLEFITENQGLDQEDLVKGLLKLDCNFTMEECSKQLKTNHDMYEGIKAGDLYWGAYLIISARDDEYKRELIREKFLEDDKQASIYNLIRLLTGDENYTKDNILKRNNPLVRTRTNHIND